MQEDDLRVFGCRVEKVSDEEWTRYVQEIMTPGTVLLPISGPVQTMLEEVAMPYLKSETALEECMGQLEDKLRIYISE